MTALLLSQDPVTFTDAVPLFDSGSQSQQTTSLETIQNAQPPMSPPASISSTQTTKVSTPSKPVGSTVNNLLSHDVAPYAPEAHGLTLSREQLKVHASGNISEIYGPVFKPQDQYAIQTRMPEPPLLLADRVTGLDAEAGSMKLGTIWTETDVREDSWFTHGTDAAGIMIESGAADLMLISYLGIDLLTKGERSYRLLGCELMYHEDLPAVGETLCVMISM